MELKNCYHRSHEKIYIENRALNHERSCLPIFILILYFGKIKKGKREESINFLLAFSVIQLLKSTSSPFINA